MVSYSTYLSLVKLQPCFLSLRWWKMCLRQNCSLGFSACSEGPAFGQNTNDIYIRRLFFFQGPIGRDIKTRNILYATFNHTYQLLLYICGRSDVDIFRSVVPTFQYPRHRSQWPVLSANSLRWSAAHCAKMLSSYDSFKRGKR